MITLVKVSDMQQLRPSPNLDPLRAELPFPILSAHQPEFLPWLGSLSKMAAADVYFILDTIQFGKELFQNRNKIRIHGDKGWQWLTVPIHDAKQSLLNWQDVRINNRVPWKRKHLSALKYSYSKAPYFDQTYTEVEKIYENFSGDSLIDFVTRFIYFAQEKFHITTQTYRTSQLDYEFTGKKTDLIIEMCKVAGAKSFIFGELGRNYIEVEKFGDIEYRFQKYDHATYNQVHGKFMSHMCFLDVMFNHGPECVNILNKSNFDVA